MSGLCPLRNCHFDQHWFNNLIVNLSREIKDGKTTETRTLLRQIKGYSFPGMLMWSWMSGCKICSSFLEVIFKTLLARTEVLTTVPWWTEAFHNKCLECLAPATFLPCCLHSCPFPSACTDFTWQGWKLLFTRWLTANLLSTAEHRQTTLTQHSPTAHWWSSSLALCLFPSTLLYLTRAVASVLCVLN